MAKRVGRGEYGAQPFLRRKSLASAGQYRLAQLRLGGFLRDLQHAFLWEDGGTTMDLNTLFPRGSNLQLIDASRHRTCPVLGLQMSRYRKSQII